ncbi:MAG: hypothetical protein JNK72_24115 [Myxococcales bacterium]|nr:hypothetical protein [Myxococcales bacterium]
MATEDPRSAAGARSRRSSFWALMALGCGLLRCDDAGQTQLLVWVTAAPLEGLPIAAVDVTVESEDRERTYDSAHFELVGGAAGRFALPLTLGVVPRDASGARVRVTARAELRDAALSRPLVASAVTGFVPGQKLLLPLVLDVRCSLGRPCPEGQVCAEQVCGPELRQASTLRVLGAGAPGPSTGSTCLRPRDACLDRCDAGERVAVARFVDREGRATLGTDLSEAPCCRDAQLDAPEVFAVSPTPRPDLLPLYRCRNGAGMTHYTLHLGCEGDGVNDGVLGYVVSPVTPGRCDTVPLFRLHDPDTSERLSTVDLRERDRLVAGGFLFEGVTAYVWPEVGPRCATGAQACVLANAVSRCEGARCAVARCIEGFADCNADPDDGCEVDTRHSAGHCGRCGAACREGEVCDASQCRAAALAERVGCADATREGFADRSRFPEIAACGGRWLVPGVFPPTPRVSLAACANAGNSSDGRAETAHCAAANLCALGWHLCRGGEIAARTQGQGCAGSSFAPESFFAASVSGPGCYRCALATNAVTGALCTNASCSNDCRPTVCSLACRAEATLTNDLFGCGTLGYSLTSECDGLDRTAGDLCSQLPSSAWRCGGVTSESRTVTKPDAAHGGVLCCRDP